MLIKSRIVCLITNRILLGEFAPGQLLKEEALAAEFSVSRTPIREVLASLVAKGYAEYELQRGVTAPRIELNTARNLLEAMEVMIPWTVQLGAKRADSENVKILEDHLLRMQEASIEPDVAKFAIAYWTWVKEISNAVGNKYICRADKAVSFHVHRIRTIAMKEWPNDQIIASMSATLTYAADMVKAFAAHDAEESRRLVVDTIRRIRKEIAVAQMGLGWDSTDENHRPRSVEPLKAS